MRVEYTITYDAPFDQTLFLWALTQQKLSMTHMEIEKTLTASVCSGSINPEV